MTEIDIVAANNTLTPLPQRPAAIVEEDEDELEAEEANEVEGVVVETAEEVGMATEVAMETVGKEEVEEEEDQGDEEKDDNESSDSDSDLDFKPVSISDQLKVGRHSGDRSTQTTESEVTPLIQLVDSLRLLQVEADELKREFHLSRGTMTTEFEKLVTDKTLELQAQINEQADRLERQQAKKLDVARRAHQAELNEAVIKVHRMYNSGYKVRQPDQQQQQQQGGAAGLAELRRVKNTVLRMEAELKRAEEEIQRLTDENRQVTEELEAANLALGAPPPPPVVVERKPSGPVYKQSDMDSLERRLQDAASLAEQREVEISQLKEELSSSRQEASAASAEASDLRATTAELRESLERLEASLEAARAEAAASQSELRAAWEEEASAMAKEAREAALAEARAAAAEAADAAGEYSERRLSELRASLSAAETALAEERRSNAERLEQLKDVEKLRRSEEEQRRLVGRLRAELKQLDLLWEKKFAVLKRSLHAVKDESFLRQQVQRQAAVLHQASVMYAADVPAGQPPQQPQAQQQQQQQQQPQQKGLSIAGSNKQKQKGFHQQRAELLSYTASAPVSAGARTASGFHSDDENQVCDAEEELPFGVVPLPERPTNATVRRDCA